MAELQHIFVTELPETRSIGAQDYILISQKAPADAEYMSRKVQYQELCSTMLNDIDDKISASVSASVADLTLSVRGNTNAISAVSSDLCTLTTAVVKIANCVQKNKFDISAISNDIQPLNLLASKLSSMSISAENGLSIEISAGQYKWKVGHSNNIAALTTSQLRSIKYDKHGHITAAQAVTAQQIDAISSYVREAGTGLSIDKSTHTVGLKTATSTEIGGVKVNGNNVSLINGVLSAKDTTYTNGVGLTLDGTAFSLSPAGTNALGGIKVGANLSVASDGTLCAAYNGKATTDKLGMVLLGYTADNESQKNYPLSVTANGQAFVHVPWENTETEFSDNTLQVTSPYSVISSIYQQGGNVISVGQSTGLHDLIRELSGKTVTTDVLSDYLPNDLAELTYELSDGLLSLNNNELTIATASIPAVISGDITTQRTIQTEGENEGENEEHTESGLYAKLAANNGLDVYVDLPYEDWTFTLDDDSTIIKRVFATTSPTSN